MDKKQQLQLKRTFDPLVKLTDDLATARIQAAQLAAKKAQVELEVEKARLVPGKGTKSQVHELLSKVSQLTDHLRENRDRIDRLRTERLIELGILLGHEFTREQVVTYASQFCYYATDFPLYADLPRYLPR